MVQLPSEARLSGNSRSLLVGGALHLGQRHAGFDRQGHAALHPRRGCGSAAWSRAALRHEAESARPPVRYCRPGGRAWCRSHGRWRSMAETSAVVAGFSSSGDVALIFAAPFFQMRRDLGRVFGKALSHRPHPSAGAMHRSWRSGRGRAAQAVVDRFANAGVREWATPRSGWRTLSSSRSMANRLAAASLRSPRGLTGSAWRPAHRRNPAALRRIRSRWHSGAGAARGA